MLFSHCLPEGENAMTPPNADEVVKEIAAQTNTPAETASKMYSDLLAEYYKDARIADYLPALVARRVRENIRAASRS